MKSTRHTRPTQATNRASAGPCPGFSISRTCVAVLLALSTLGAQAATPAGAAAGKQTPLFSAERFASLKLRELGPASTSGRIGDIAVVPGKPNAWYVAVASGGVWKTVNAGTTWTPVFDAEGSYSIGCVTVDPNNPHVVWVGTGENNSQRSVSYGDGVYKSMDGGASWVNTGLKSSEHIGKIVVDPTNSDVVYAAAQGPLWNSGGERGLYKTVDGGKTWKPSLTFSKDTGVSDLWMDPRDPKLLYATSYQRRRHVWGMIHGGPENAIWKSTDAGATWRKVDRGLPKSDLGRIGLAVSPVTPDVVTAIVEASDPKERGVYRSTNRGESWSRMSDYVSSSPQYYQELVPDPKKADRIYSMDVYTQVTEDGGKTWKRLDEKYKHVDNHALWIDPNDNDHLLNGNDGGVYESWDRGANWAFKANLPVAQFYRATADDSLPFYHVYGGTQDNNTVGAPSRTTTNTGITNADWFVTTGGDGFVTAIDPTDPNIVYSESQHGVLVRFDRKTGERIGIQPQPAKGEAPDRWNWDSPLKISPHSPTRLYFASQRIYRSDDRGDTWRAVSPDLSSQTNRNHLKMMGKVWSVDAVARHTSTSFYGNIVSLAESPKVEGLLYAGTDDGLVQVSEDGGARWRRQATFPGVPADSYVSDLKASPHQADTVYATFDNHKMGDFKPYIYRSADRGRTWTSITGDLPQRGTVYSMAEDPEKPGLLYAGTEFGAFFSPDGGRRWVQLKGGMPTIAVRDVSVQKREGDLVLGTFGRGIFILDDLTPIRRASEEMLAAEATLLPVKKAWMYIPSTPLGLREKAALGASFYAAPNPPFGAVFTFHLKDDLKTQKKQRQEAEKKVAAGGDVPVPSMDALQSEALEEEPSMVLTVSDSNGNVVRRLNAPAKSGFTRLAWDLRYPPADPSQLKSEGEENVFEQPARGPLVLPGTYSVVLDKQVRGQLVRLAGPVKFDTELLGSASLPSGDRAQINAFAQQVAQLQRAVLGAGESVKETHKRLDLLAKALTDTPAAPPAMQARVRELKLQLGQIETALHGDKVRAKYQEPTANGLQSRVLGVVRNLWFTRAAPTGTQRQVYAAAAEEFGPLLGRLRGLVERDLKELETQAEAAGAPWTPGRVPVWGGQ